MRLLHAGRLAAVVSMVLALAVGCAPRQPPEVAPPVVEPAPEVRPTPPTDGVVSTRLDRFCNALQRVVDQHRTGFAGLRNGVVGQRAWSGSIVPEGLTTCTVEGDSPTGARYVCTGPRMQRGNGPLIAREFTLLADDVDACLARAAWFPRNWQRGQVIEFAGVEQQQTWRDISPAPRPLLALNIEDDFLNRLYVVRFTVSTLR
jgi:hypothetical protein